jgi:riboflavin synthase
MFAGIIQNQGRLLRRQKRGSRVELVFGLKKKADALQVGESMAVDGVCLTVKKTNGKSFAVDVVPETLEATTLGSLRVSDTVNLERSLRRNDFVGGHFVTGHVDGCGEIVKMEKKGQYQVMTIQAPKTIFRFLAQKGSIACDGVSLTIQEIRPASRAFKIALIPHTLRETTLSRKKAGDRVNLEVDLIARYLDVLNKTFGKSSSSRLRVRQLTKQGF